jgi:hypothetical protein
VRLLLKTNGNSTMKPISKTRDTRLDVLRALALLMIFIDHVPGQPLEMWTLRNFGFSDASEIFVLISGIAVALAYGGKYQPGNLVMLGLKAWRRAVKLFAAHLAGTFLTMAIFLSFAWMFSRSDILDGISITPVMEAHLKGLLAIVTLGHQLGFNNILPMYMALMLLAPVIIWLERKSPALLLALSAALWSIAGTWRIGPPNMLMPGIWFFNPLSWQFLFVIGYVAMRASMRGEKVGGNPRLLALAIAYVLFAGIWIVGQFGQYDLSLGLPYVLTAFDKTYLTGWRLLNVLAMAYIFISVPQLSALARRAYDNPLSVIGRHGLAIFVTGTVLSVLAQAIMAVSGATPGMGIALVVVGILLQIALAYLLERRARDRRERRIAPSTVKPLPQGLGRTA